MSYKKCPICELNYIVEDSDCCDLCKKKSCSFSIPKTQRTYSFKEDIKRPSQIFNKYFYFVFQGDSFDEESTNKYIFAPNDGIHHHERLRELKEGDILFHAEAGFIKAISIVKSNAYSYSRKDKNGFRVNCDYTLLSNKLNLTD